MANEIRQFTQVDRTLPSRSGRICRVLCLFLAGCASEADAIECGAPAMLRIERVVVPANNTGARASGHDLDGDGVVDNLLGMVTGSLAIGAGIELSTPASARLASDVEWYVGVAECDDGTARLAIGPDVSTPALVAERTGTQLHGSGEDAGVPLSTLLDPFGTYPNPGWLRSGRTRMMLEPLPDGTWQGVVGVALDPDQVTDAIVRPLAPYFDEHQLFIEYLDKAPADGRITVEEMKSSSYVKSLLSPDLQLEDGRDMLSFGVRFTAR